MIKYFIGKRDIPQVEEIILLLNKKKERLSHNDFSEPYREYKECEKVFDEVLEVAKQQNDEVFANSQYVVRKYFLLFCNLCMYFELLKEKRYRSSWDKLQDCIGLAKMVGSYIEIENRLEISKVLHLLSSYETLYPYSVFASSEYIVSKSHCSICGQSMLSLSCQHIKGKLYWGEVAVEMIDEIKTFQAVALVSHPEDKRCVIELSDDNRTEVEKFKRIDQFLELNQPFLQDFSIQKIIENRMRDNIKIVGRNDPCSCGSGVKFKKCCGKDLYYKHERNIITPLQTVSMIKL